MDSTALDPQALRDDADWLLSIRHGAMAYDELVDWAESRLAALPALLEASPLPEEPPRDGAEELVVEICEEFLFHPDLAVDGGPS